MSDLFVYLKEVFTHWQNWASGGGIGGAVLVVLLAIERIRRKTLLNTRTYVLIAIFAFAVAASYRAWRDQYHSVLREQEQLNALTVPHLDGTIGRISAGPRPDHKRDALLFLWVQVSNQGAPSVVEVVRCKVHTASGGDTLGEFITLPEHFALIYGDDPPKAAVVYPRSESFLLKTMDSPVTTGGALAGFLLLVIPNTKPAEIMSPGTLVSVTLHDVRGNKFELNRVVSAQDIRMRVMSDEDEDEAMDELDQ
jgi:hypothetical protein